MQQDFCAHAIVVPVVASLVVSQAVLPLGFSQTCGWLLRENRKLDRISKPFQCNALAWHGEIRREAIKFLIGEAAFLAGVEGNQRIPL